MKSDPYGRWCPDCRARRPAQAGHCRVCGSPLDQPPSSPGGLGCLWVLAAVALLLLLSGLAVSYVSDEWEDGPGLGLALLGGQLLFVPAAVFVQRLSWRRGLRSRTF